MCLAEPVYDETGILAGVDVIIFDEVLCFTLASFFGVRPGCLSAWCKRNTYIWKDLDIPI